MSFLIKYFLKWSFCVFFKSKGTDAQLTSSRVKLLIILVPFGVSLLFINWFCLLMDEIFLWKFRKIKIKKPLFIIGSLRSGTTFLHRLISNDKQFTTLKTWEVLIAPSIIQKKLCLAIDKIDKKYGNRLKKAIVRFQDKTLQEFNEIHRVSFFEPEEDHLILYNILATFGLVFILPFFKDFQGIVHFDKELSPIHKKDIMRFYRKCIQRHLYVFGRDKIFLSKNPSFSSKIETLKDVFPDSRFVCTIRTPLETYPSAHSLMSYCFNSFCSVRKDTNIDEFINDLHSHWYKYPVERLIHWPIERYYLMEYSKLVSAPLESVLDIYERFQYDMSSKARQKYIEAQERAQKYKSKHKYNIDKDTTEAKELTAEFNNIIAKYNSITNPASNSNLINN